MTTLNRKQDNQVLYGVLQNGLKKTSAIGLIVKKGKYGGTYAHKYIAFEFASCVSPQFKLYLLKEFKQLKRRRTKATWLNSQT